MKRISTLMMGLTLCAAVGLHAQAKRQAPMTRTQPMSHPTNSAKKPTTPSTTAPKSNSDAFKGIAAKLGTTPDVLQTAYEAAKQANPKLSRGNFVAANMLAHNLGSKNPAITTQAILSGLQSGKSIGQTLQSLGVSGMIAKKTEQQAAREAKDAEHEADTD